MAQTRRRNNLRNHYGVANILLPILMLSLINQSCDSRVVYNQNNTLKNRNWTYAKQVQFPVQISDSTLKYNVYLSLRHTKDYEYENIYVLVQEKGPKNTDTTIRRTVPLATPDGRWLGKFAASLYEVEYLLHENHTFPDTGIHVFAVEQSMRDSPLSNIATIGLKVIEK